MGNPTNFSLKDNISYKELITTSPVAIYTCDENGFVTFCNAAAIDLWGRAPQIGVDKWCGSWKIYYPNGVSMPLAQCPMARTLKEKQAFIGEEIVIERPNHTYRNILVYPIPIFDSDHKLKGAHNTLVDITDRKTGEEKQAILSAIVESSDDAIISKNLDGVIQSWNAGAQKIFGYTEAEVVGKHISILIPASLQAEEETIISQIKAGNKIDHFQTTRLHKEGKNVQVSLTVSPVKDNMGNIMGASKIARDITAQLAAEQLIQRTAQKLQILNSIGKTISEKLNVETILQKVTDATTSITGATFGVFFYNTTNERGEASMLYTVSGISKTAFDPTTIFKPAFNGESVIRVDDITKDYRYTKSLLHDGIPKEYPAIVSYLAVPVISSSGTVLGELFLGHPNVGFFEQDLEDLVISITSQAAVALENSQLFETVKALNIKKDEFIALASHELKTPLTTIKGYLQILDRNEKDKISKTFIGRSIDQLGKLNSLISDLFDISKIEAGRLQFDFEQFDLRNLLIEVMQAFQYNTTSHTLHLEDTENEVLIVADKQRIEQVLINLITNAIKYSPKANKVYLKLSVSGQAAIVKVKDEGIGLSTSQQENIFTRFYRAEGTAGISGLGLGLYLTKEIIDRHQGQICVNSELGKGAEFLISLPLKRNGTEHN